MKVRSLEISEWLQFCTTELPIRLNCSIKLRTEIGSSVGSSDYDGDS